MAKIKIDRSNEYANRLRDYGIYIDNIKIGTISNGETKEFTVDPGTHQIIAKIDWCSSKELSFELRESEIKNFKVAGFKNGNWMLPTAMGFIFFSFALKRTVYSQYLSFAVIPAFLILVYYLTLGRKRYLTLLNLSETL